MTSAKICWCLDSSFASHRSQTAGIIGALEQLYTIKVYWLSLKPLNRWLYWLLCGYINLKKGAVSPHFLRYFVDGPLPSNTPNYVLSAGDNTAAINAWIATAYQAKNILCGRPRMINEDLFAVVLAPRALLNSEEQLSDGYIGLTVMPTACHSAANDSSAAKGSWLLLFGGDSATKAVHYSLSEVSKLATTMNAIAREQQLTWLVLSTNGTSYQQEQALNGVLESSIIAEAHWSSGQKTQPYPLLPSLFAKVHVVVITAEAIHLIHEAVAAGKTVIAVKPDAFEVGAEDAEVLAAYLRDKHLLLCPIDRLRETLEQISSIKVVGTEAQSHLVQQLASNANLHVYRGF